MANPDRHPGQTPIGEDPRIQGGRILLYATLNAFQLVPPEHREAVLAKQQIPHALFRRGLTAAAISEQAGVDREEGLELFRVLERTAERDPIVGAQLTILENFAREKLVFSSEK